MKIFSVSKLITVLAIFVLASVCQPVISQNLESYPLTATFEYSGTEPVDGFNLYIGCDNIATRTLITSELVADSPPIETTVDLLSTRTYHFCVTAYNAAGESPVAEVVTVNMYDWGVPSPPSNTNITIGCDNSCTVTVTNVPVE